MLSPGTTVVRRLNPVRDQRSPPGNQEDTWYVQPVNPPKTGGRWRTGRCAMANLAMLALSVVAIVAVFISLRAEEDETGDGEDTELPSLRQAQENPWR